MGQNAFNEEIKTRVPGSVKRRLEAQAQSRELDLSDIVREALREYLAKQPLVSDSRPQTLASTNGGQS